MTPRENYLRAVRFEKPDYIPMSFHINAACWHHYDQEQLKDLIEEHKLNEKCAVLFSTVYGKVKPSELAKWILGSKTSVTMQVPLHKEIWGPDERGV